MSPKETVFECHVVKLAVVGAHTVSPVLLVHDEYCTSPGRVPYDTLLLSILHCLTGFDARDLPAWLENLCANRHYIPYTV